MINEDRKLTLFKLADIAQQSFSESCIGSRVLNSNMFCDALRRALATYDTSKDRVSGQHYVVMHDVLDSVTCGIGLRTDNVNDYVVRKGRFGVDCYLKRKHALAVASLAVVVYTMEAYLNDPDIQNDTIERDRMIAYAKENITHVIVAVLASPEGPGSPLSPMTFAHNLAGGNHEAVREWSKDDILAKAKDVESYWTKYCLVAD